MSVRFVSVRIAPDRAARGAAFIITADVTDTSGYLYVQGGARTVDSGGNPLALSDGLDYTLGYAGSYLNSFIGSWYNG